MTRTQQDRGRVVAGLVVIAALGIAAVIAFWS
jgi:hypothetical protein